VKSKMSYTISRIADYGTGNPILARLTLQTFAILDHCEIRQEDADAVKLIYMESLTKKLVRCYEIALRFQAEFVNEKLTIIRGRSIELVTQEEGLVTIVFRDYSTMRANASG
jgi:hypothetical protein